MKALKALANTRWYWSSVHSNVSIRRRYWWGWWRWLFWYPTIYRNLKRSLKGRHHGPAIGATVSHQYDWRRPLSLKRVIALGNLGLQALVWRNKWCPPWFTASEPRRVFSSPLLYQIHGKSTSIAKTEARNSSWSRIHWRRWSKDFPEPGSFPHTIGSPYTPLDSMEDFGSSKHRQHFRTQCRWLGFHGFHWSSVDWPYGQRSYRDSGYGIFSFSFGFYGNAGRCWS